MAYATLEELAEYLDVQESGLEEDSERLLEMASLLIDHYTLGKVDITNLSHIEAAKLAVCAQVEYWHETGDNVGLLETYGSLSLGSFSVSRGSGTASTPQLQLAPRAYQALFMEGLLYRGVDIK